MHSVKAPIYRQDADQPVFNFFTHRLKISIIAPQGRLVAPMHVKFSKTKGHVGPLGRVQFRANRFMGVGTRPQKYQKFPLFGKESTRRGEPLDRFLKFYGLLYE